MPSVSRDEFDTLHAKVDDVRETVARIEGKLDQQNNSWQWFGVISALILGLWNMIK